ncbi:MAG: ceramidase domain-containing protein [Chitinophagales bacterium]|jgi:hypothetical protein|nr:ceramidase domain-containing protein [Chitinophagales bacterium]
MNKQSIYKIYFIAFFTTVLLCLIFIFLNHNFDGSYWQSLQQSKSALTVEYCELDQVSHFFRQTMNTYSNLMYFFLGMIVVLIGFHDRKNKKENLNIIQKFPALSILLGGCLVYLCFGSAFFHASLTWLGQRIDMNATYSICLVLIGISFYKLKNNWPFFQQSKGIYILFIFLLILLFIPLHLLLKSTYLLPFLILLLVILTGLNYTKNKKAYSFVLMAFSFIFLIAAFILRTLDVQKMGCHPTSIYQGHAVWHVCTGISAFLLYQFYRNEKV